ncbi:MAG: IS3 family transposase [Proteobacteria bacterium]|nr:IS3 family transposase [Pseudomonadota bacterium]
MPLRGSPACTSSLRPDLGPSAAAFSPASRCPGRFYAVAECFFASLKKERIRKRIHNTRATAAVDVSDYNESIRNPRRRHSHIGGVSPDDFETAAKRR